MTALNMFRNSLKLSQSLCSVLRSSPRLVSSRRNFCCVTFNRTSNNTIYGSTMCYYSTKITDDARSNSMPSTFSDMMHFRKKQAHRSVLLEVLTKDHISDATFLCEQFGPIRSLFSYNAESKNIFLLLEYEEEESVGKLLASCHCRNIADAFPICSRVICFENKKHNSQKKSSSKLKVIHEESAIRSVKSQLSVSEVMAEMREGERLTELDVRLRFFLCSLLKDALRGLYPHCDALPFGSSVNGVGRTGCDLDVVLRLHPPQMDPNSDFYFLNKTIVGDPRALQQKTIWCLGDFLRTFIPGVSSLQKILHARVPILKFTHKILGLECDLSANNVSAVLMSDILYTCGEIDSRFRPLVYAVKRWAKECNITYETPGPWITNFGLTLLVIFFLQRRPAPILPVLSDMVRIVGEELTSEFRLDYLMSLSEMQSKASANSESLACLFKEFLAFLGSHPLEDRHVSIISGLSSERPGTHSLWVPYPFEESLNVTKNVSAKELWDLCEKAHFSAHTLESSMQARICDAKDLLLLLGVPTIRSQSQRSKRFNVAALLEDSERKKKTDKKRASR